MNIVKTHKITVRCDSVTKEYTKKQCERLAGIGYNELYNILATGRKLLSAEDREVYVSANGGKSIKVKCPSTGSWTSTGTVSFKISLKNGENTLKFSNETQYAPDLDCITVK